jgi:hypothetical protein
MCHTVEMGAAENGSMLRRLAPILVACAAWFQAAAAADTTSTPTPLSFSDFYKRPIGSHGLEPAARLLALTGQRVRLTGFIARSGESPGGPIILAPVPVTLSDEDEALADDLPASVAYIHGAGATLAEAMRRCQGPIQAIGLLELGPLRETNERVSYVRLMVEAARCATSATAPQLP